jgi:WD40 repeat protein
MVACWLLPAAAYCVLRFDPWLAPGLFSSGMALLVALLYGLAWICLPLALLIVGSIFLPMAVPGRRRAAGWITAWITAIMAGIALGVTTASGIGAEYDPAHTPWYQLAEAAGFVAIAAVMIAALIGATRSGRRAVGLENTPLRALAPRAARTLWRTPGRRIIALCGALAVAASVAAIALAPGAAPVVALAVGANTVDAIAYSPDGTNLAVADDLGDITVRDVAGGRRAVRFTDPVGGPVNVVAFSPRGGVLAVGLGSDIGMGDGQVDLWNAATGRPVASLRDPVGGASVHAVAFSPDGKVIAAGDDAGVITLWDAATGRRLALWWDHADGVGKLDKYAQANGVDSLVFSGDGGTFASASYDGTVDVWSTATQKLAATTHVHGVSDASSDETSSSISVSFTPDGRTLAIADADSGAYLWNVVVGNPVRAVTWKGCGGGYWGVGVAFSPDGRSVAIAGSSADADRACVWNVASGALVATMTDPVRYNVSAVALSPEGKSVAFGDDDGGPDTDVIIPPSAYVHQLG